MNRETALKIVLAVMGVLFVALIYPMLAFARQEPAMRDPWANRSLIAFTAWSSFAHAAERVPVR
jgi:hypothetical protein